MRKRLARLLPFILCVASALTGATTDAVAHGGGNWSAYNIDRVLDDVKERVLDAQSEMSDIIRRRSLAETWPAPGLDRMRDELIVLQEQVDEILDHYLAEGVNLTSPEQLRATPMSGRSVAAGAALTACVALLARASDLETQDAFIGELYSGGPAARLLELVDAHRDRMDLYEALTGLQPATAGTQ